MIEYSIDDLKNLTDDNLSDVSEAILNKTINISDEELKIICDKLYMYTMIYSDLNEFDKMSDLALHRILPDEDAALKKAYVAHDLEDWPACKSALTMFFEWMGDDDIQYYDLSLWNYRHLMRWFSMLSMTRLCEETSGTTIRTFADMVNEQIVNRMPEHLKPKLWDCVENVYPELAALFEVSKTVTEDGAKCVDIKVVVEHLDITEDEILKMFEGTEPGRYLVSKEHTFQIH